ncbi:glycosyltransferase [Verrucomicrobium sp. GAS474]|uniref:glycosyltransferase n=1 Tax=Verrucomicrobium sp. GAS474 TaxID=1882831 RepID=UPI000B80A5AB|nr:glycosyltransferase [Verrucomicrobium sp. GAS474]
MTTLEGHGGGERFFVDVTGCALHGGRGGIPRMSRELFGALQTTLAGTAPVVPLTWEEPLGAFARLGFFHHLHFRDWIPFRKRASLAERKWRGWTRRRRALGSGDLDGAWLVLSEVFTDGRLRWLSRARESSPRMKIAAVFHDGIALTHPHWVSPQALSGFEAYAEALTRCDAVICVSRQSRDDLVAFWAARGWPAARTEVLHWPLPGIAAGDGGNADAARPEAEPRLLCVSSLEPRKNHLLWLESCERLWREGIAFRAVLVGERTTEAGGEVVAEVARLRGLGRPLEWISGADDATLRGLYRSATFTVYPSLKEGFGLPILESLAFGKACLCGNSGAVAEVAEGGGCLPVDMADAAALAEAMRRLLLSPGERERLEREARARHFLTWGEYARRFLAALMPR